MDNSLHQLKARVASLESTVDMLESELTYLNAMLTHCGFPDGIKTLKETITELLAEDAAHCDQKRPELI